MFTLLLQLVGFIIFLSPFIFAFVAVFLDSADRRTEEEKELDRVAMKAAYARLKAKHESDLRHVRLHRDFMNSCK